MVVYFIVKKFRSRSREQQKKRSGGSEFIDSARSRTIISKEIPSFEIPGSLVAVPVQQPHRDVRAETDPSKFATNEYKPGLLLRSNHVTHVQGTFSPPTARGNRSSSFQLEETMSHTYDSLTQPQRRKHAVHEKLPTKVGRMQFSVYYDLSQKLLNINISRVSKLKREELPDTKLIVSLLCEGKQLWHDKTRTVKRNFNPQFNQKLVAYGIDSTSIRQSVLLFQAFDEQSNSLMGEAEYSLHELPNNKLVTQICALESGDVVLEKDKEVSVYISYFLFIAFFFFFFATQTAVSLLQTNFSKANI